VVVIVESELQADLSVTFTLGNGTDRQGRGHRNVAARQHRDVVLNKPLEPGGLNRNAISAGLNEVE
jgi:hypothetical protein